jgi:AcrR family transcriptional regulator
MARTKSIRDEDLLRSAREVFVKEGFAASTKTIARRAGVSEGVLFQRFSTKEELFFAAMIPPPADLSELFQRPHTDGYQAFSAVTLAMLDYFRATLPVLITLISHPSFRFEDFARKHPDSPMVTLRRDIGHFMVEEQRAGRIGPVNPGAAALVAWSTAHTIAFFEHMGAHGGQFDRRIIRATLECAWHGLAPAKRKLVRGKRR